MHTACRRIRQSSHLGKEVHLQKVGMELDDLPVRGSQGLDVDRVRLGWVKM